MDNGNTPISPMFNTDGSVMCGKDEVAMGWVRASQPFMGLTKREYFSGIILQGLIANEKSTLDTISYWKRIISFFNPEEGKGSFRPSKAEELCEWSLKCADELLKQLEK
jgi:hypothetical protein